MGGALVKSPVWGNAEYDVTQAYNVNLPNVPDNWYAYAADWGESYGDHVGVDVGMPCGTKIYAIAAGRVQFAGFSDSFRPFPVHIVTANNEEHIYGHLQQNLVQTGQAVTAGQLLGYSGQQTYKGTTTPDGSGCHLHFERRDLSSMRVLDPVPLLTGSSVTPHGGEPWPTAEAINQRIAKSEAANGTTSKLHGKGDVFLRYGRQYGINPAVVVAISQRECQLGAAPNDVVSPLNNFGGNTCGAVGVTVASGCVFKVDREWNVYPTVDAGIEAMFQTLDAPLYRETGGALRDIMAIYSPPFENDWGSMWRIFAQVGQELGVPLNESTNIYGQGAPGQGSGGGLIDLSPLLDTLEDYGERAGYGALGVLLAGIGAVVLIGPENIAKAIPAGRVVSFATKAAR